MSGKSENQLDFAYLAGVIDSDGYVTIHRYRCPKGKRYYAAKVGIAGTRRASHDLAASYFGGIVGCYIPKNISHRPQFQWSRQGRSARPVIDAILPYLRLKHVQGSLALDLQDIIDQARLDGDEAFPWAPAGWDPTPTYEALCMDARRLNQPKVYGREHGSLVAPRGAS